MNRRMTLRRWAVGAAALMVVGLAAVRGQGPGRDPFDPIHPQPGAAAPKAPGQPAWARQTEEAIRPLPLEPIPDNPPPHEGALFEISYRIEPPDLILIEALEAFPGRPITGEKLVLSDGTVSLDWYGSVHVAGLTPAQAKVKIIHHLRAHLTDQSLGLITYHDRLSVQDPKGPIPADPFPALLPLGDDDQIAGRVEKPPLSPECGGAPVGEAKAGTAVPSGKVSAKVPTFPDANDRNRLREPKPPRAPEVAAGPKPADPKVEVREVVGPYTGRYVYVDPADSTRVFVVVAAFNTKVYYVQGDVAKLGRLPWTGNETVLDAIAFSGGLLPSADRNNIRLNRPARGGKPAKSYRIDLDAIERGEKTANLQIFPGDRLIVERKDHFEPRP